MSDLTQLLSPNLLAGKPAFITGGGSGINLAIAHGLASVGADIAICGRSQDKLDAAAVELRTHGVRVLPVAADVRDPEALTAAIDRASSALGPLHIVVAGAAGNFLSPAAAMSTNGFRAVLEIDLLGSFNTARAAFEDLKATRGNILFISAGQSYLPFANQAHVGAAKAGIDSLMANLALEWGRYGIRSNSLVPGPVGDTEGMTRLTAPTGSKVWTDSVALGRFADADEIASMAVVLASPLASYTTGARVVVDGGLSLSGLGSISRALDDAT